MRGWKLPSGSSTNDACSRIVTASGDGVTLATEPENRPPPNPPPPPPPPPPAPPAPPPRRAERRGPWGGAPPTATTAGLIVDEGQRHVDFGVLREVAGVREVERAARAIEPVVTWTQASGGVHEISQEE